VSLKEGKKDMRNIRNLFILGLSALVLGSCGQTDNTSKFDTSKNITLYTRDTTSGTRDGFFTKIGIEDAKTDDSKLRKGVTQTSGNSDMMAKVANDTYGIGYASLAGVVEDTTGKIKGLKYEGVEANEENVLNETYKLTRNFNYIIRNDYAADDKKGLVVKAFVAYMFSKDGQRTMKEADGILTISGKDWTEVAKDYESVLKDSTLNFEIKVGGSTSVQKMSQKLTSNFAALLTSKNVKFTHNHGGSGDAYKYTQGADKDSTNKLDIAFLSRELKDTEKAAEGTSGKMCVDAIVPIVNSANPYSETTAKDLVAMYSVDGKNDDKVDCGMYTKWSDVIK